MGQSIIMHESETNVHQSAKDHMKNKIKHRLDSAMQKHKQLWQNNESLPSEQAQEYE